MNTLVKATELFNQMNAVHMRLVAEGMSGLQAAYQAPIEILGESVRNTWLIQAYVYENKGTAIQAIREFIASGGNYVNY